MLVKQKSAAQVQEDVKVRLLALRKSFSLLSCGKVRIAQQCCVCSVRWPRSEYQTCRECRTSLNPTNKKQKEWRRQVGKLDAVIGLLTYRHAAILTCRRTCGCSLESNTAPESAPTHAGRKQTGLD